MNGPQRGGSKFTRRPAGLLLMMLAVSVSSASGCREISGELMAPIMSQAGGAALPSHVSSAAPSDGKTFTVGVALGGDDDAFDAALRKGMESAADGDNVALDIQCAAQNSRLQQSQVESLIGRHVDAIVLAPASPDSAKSAIASVNAAGIPLFVACSSPYASSVDNGRIVSIIGPDYALAGRMAAGRMTELLHGQGTVLIEPTGGSLAARDAVNGFTAELAGHPLIKLVSGGTLANIGVGIQNESNPSVKNKSGSSVTHIDGIFAGDERATLSAIQACRAAGRADAVIVGCSGDASAAAHGAIPQLKAEVRLSPDRLGAESIDTVRDYLDRKPVDRTILVAPESIGRTDISN